MIKEANEKYSQYKIYDNSENAIIADVNNRKTKQSIVGIILDIHKLSLMDYVVCTQSSNVSNVSPTNLKH